MQKRDEQYNIQLTDNTVRSCSPTTHMLNVSSWFLPPPLKTLPKPFLTSTSLQRQQHTPIRSSTRGTECLHIREATASGLKRECHPVHWSIHDIYFTILH